MKSSLRNLMGCAVRTGIAMVTGALLSAGAFAATGGGATIHNAATLTFNSGQQVTDWVNVQVQTIGQAPAIVLTSPGPFLANAGDTVTLSYTATSTTNGSDSYSLSAATSTFTGLAPGTTFSVSANTLTLGATVTTAPSTGVDGDTGTIVVPAGSTGNFTVGDTVLINGYPYTVEAVRNGVVASTVGNTTTQETHAEIDLTVPVASGSPVIGNGTIAAGIQVGELQTFTVSVVVTAPTTVGVDGAVSPVITGNTSALDTGGSPVPYDTSTDGSGTNDPSITVKSATATIFKEVRNVTKGGVFATSGVTAQPGDVLEYRLTMTAAAGFGDAVSSVLRNEVPDYCTYVPNSTTLNGVAVADDGGAQPFPLAAANNGLGVNSANGAADQVNGGTLKDGDNGANAAIVLFRAAVQ